MDLTAEALQICQLRCTQKLLDRVLLCAFCEDRGLLPAETIKHDFEHRDPHNPHPGWHNF